MCHQLLVGKEVAWQEDRLVWYTALLKYLNA